MRDYQQAFLRFAVDSDVLCFGEFTLKSGRVSPYFFNTGLFNHGASLARLGEFYAAAISDRGVEFDMLYGPAYKGIPLVASVAIALARNHGRNLPFSFNRKEAKDHGEGGALIGSALRGGVLIVDDVISSGVSINEAAQIITAHGARCAGVFVALDRQERGTDTTLAAQDLAGRIGAPVQAIATLEVLIEFISADTALAQHAPAVRDYSARYGAG